MHAVIVAGGLGTRAHALTGDKIPKALLPVAGVPIVVRQMRVLAREGVTRITVLAGHLGDQLRVALSGAVASLGIDFDVVVEREPLGTAGCLANLPAASEDTLIVYGDMLFDLALTRLQDCHSRSGALITIVAHPNDHPRTSDLLVERDGLVAAILPRKAARDTDYRNLVPAGLYLARPDFFRRVPQSRTDMIGDVLPALVAAGEKIGVYNTPEDLRDVGSPARHAMAEKDIASGLPEALSAHRKRPAIFFDVDGVLNYEPGTRGALKPDDVVVVPGAGKALHDARQARHLAVGVTNRPQVARGDINFECLDHILGRLEALVAATGGILDRIYYCPHHPDRGFPGEVASLKFACECRKPGTLLFRQAVADLPIDLCRSASIGDSLRDVGAARGMGIWAYGVRTGYGCRDSDRYPGGPAAAPSPDLIFADVGEAVQFCLSYRAIAAPILDALRSRQPASAPFILAICGRSRSGKSIVAHAVSRCLAEDGVTCLNVHLDDWIVPAEQRNAEMGAEARSRVEALPGIVEALRASKLITAPGYDAHTRNTGPGRVYEPAGKRIIILDGLFAAHATVRHLVDLAVFVAPLTEDQYKERFRDLYRWKGLSEEAIEQLWDARIKEEWPRIDAQRSHADLVVSGMALQ